MRAGLAREGLGRGTAALALLPAVLAAALGLGGCQKALTCGQGTKAEGGQCVPVSLAHCGDGTHLEGEACVPDVACGAGTKAQDGSCVPADPLTCGQGTEEREGKCVVLDPLLRVTVAETAEPNVPPGKPAHFILPQPGAAPAVLGGVVGPVQNGVPDFDGFTFHGDKNARIRLTGKAIGAPTVGVALQPCLGGKSPCQLDPAPTFSRFALTLTARGAAREVVLPSSGEWILLVTDQDNLAQGLPMGAADFSYTVDVEQLPPVAPKALSAGQTVSGTIQDLDQYAWTVTDAQPLFDLVLAAPAAPFPGVRALWVAPAADGPLLLNVLDDSAYGYVQPLAPQRLAPPAGSYTVTVDYQYALGDPAQYALSLNAVPLTALGDLAQPASRQATLGNDGTSVFTVDLQANGILQAEVVLPPGSALLPQVELRSARYEPVQSVQGNKLSRFTAAGHEGRYYLVVSDRAFVQGKPAMPFTLQAHADPVQPVGPVAADLGAVSVDAAVGATGSSWFAVYAGNDSKLALTARPTGGSDLALAAWPPSLRRAVAESTNAPAGQAEAVSGLLLPAGGVILAQVSGAAGSAFSLSATATGTVAVFETETNDDPARANPLPLDAHGHAEAAGELPTTSDADVFQVVLPSAGHLTVETHAGLEGGKADTRVALLDQAGQALATNDDQPNGERLSKLVTSVPAGTYYVRVQRWSSYAPYDGTDYVVTVDLTP